MVPTPQQIILTAKELHKFYRAATKAIGDTNYSIHDHGWSGCTRKGKVYFMRRATKILVALPVEPQRSCVALTVQNGNVSIH